MKKRFLSVVIMMMLIFAVGGMYVVSCPTTTHAEKMTWVKDGLIHRCDLHGEESVARELINGSILTTAANLEGAINEGYLVAYVDSFKACGLVSADFVPSVFSSNNSSTNSSSTKSTVPKEPTLTERGPSTYVTIREAEAYDGYNGGKKTGATVAPDVDVTVTASSSNGYLRLEDGTFVESGALVSKEEYDAAWAVTEEVPATCTEAGYVKKTNSLSGKETEETLEVLGHDYAMVDYLTPTCVDAGYDTYACNRCGDEYMEELEALGHDSGESVVTVEPKAFSKGVRTTYCTVCGEVVSEETIPQTFPIPLWGVVVIAVLVVGGITTGVVFIVKKRK